MKLIFKHLFIAAITILLFGLTSCSDYLDTVPGDKLDDNALWSNPSLVEGYVYHIYQGIPYPYQWYMSASLVDEAVPIQNDGVVTKVITSTLTPDDQGVFANNWACAMENWWWKSVYSNIRSCNMFFEKIEQTEFTDDSYKQQLIGEVHFLRGYFYSLLMTQYGGVPIIDKVMSIGDSYEIPRKTFEETVDFIISDLDAAVADNKLAGQTDKTRATEGAVYALKSRVLLYAASDLHHSTSWQNGYAHPELVGYTTDNQKTLYQAAKVAAEKVIGMGYELYNENSDKSANFQELFLQMSSKEQIFITLYDKVNTPYWATDWLAWVCGTPSYGGWGLNQVTANLADAFENADGTSFNIGTQSEDPYSNRDPRFNATILHNGSSWYYNSWGYLSPVTIDITQGSDYNTGNTTGYYIKKFISNKDGENTWYYGSRQPQPYIQIRYAEVLLNYAEACIGLGEDANARTAINQIRQRAGMPDITESGSALLTRYRNERRVELAWEGHRIWDVRRWLVGSQGYANARGVKVVENKYTEFDFETRAWKDSHYLIPIPRTEINKNSALIQNPGY
jgi:starch-binding outer membrane protein, SusD/RagB family